MQDEAICFEEIHEENYSKILSDENFRTLFILIHLSLKTIKSILILFGLLFTYCTKI